MQKLRRNEMLLWFGKWTSKIGNIVFDYANSVSIVSLFRHNPVVLAVYQSSETIIQIIFNLIGGAKADNGNRKRIVIVTDFFSAAICLILSFFVHSTLAAEIMIAANALLALVNAFNSPTYKSIVREMIEKDRIGFFNSIANGGGELIRIAGPMVGLLLVDAIGVRGALIFDAATFLVSALSEAMLVRVGAAAVKPKEKRNVLKEIAEGFRYLVGETQIFYLVILSALVNFFLAGYNLLIPYTDVMYAGVFSGFYGKVLIMEAVGGILGSLISTKLGGRAGRNARLLILFLGATGVFLILEPLASLSGLYWVCLLPFLGFGAALTVFNIQFMSYVQIRVAEDFLGRVFSIIFTVAVLFMPLGSYIFSFVFDTAAVISFAFVGLGIVLLAVVNLFLISK